MTIKLSRLGLRIDGWADLVEGAGGKATVALQAVTDTMKRRGMPAVEIKPDNAAPNAISSKRRPYVLVEMPNGASVTAYLGQYGSDLYASWDLYIRPKLETRTVIIILVLSLLSVIPGSLCGSVSSFSFLGQLGKLLNPQSIFGGGGGGANLTGYYFAVIFSLLCLSGVGFLASVIFLAFLVAVAGYVVKGNWLAFFIKELTPFDADDIGAMGLAVHKSVVLALDSVGVSIKTLRLKEVFKAGGQGRLI
jgi:hypothetical protein